MKKSRIFFIEEMRGSSLHLFVHFIKFLRKSVNLMNRTSKQDEDFYSATSNINVLLYVELLLQNFNSTDDNFNVKKCFYSLFLRFNLAVKSYYLVVKSYYLVIKSCHQLVPFEAKLIDTH